MVLGLGRGLVLLCGRLLFSDFGGDLFPFALQIINDGLRGKTAGGRDLEAIKRQLLIRNDVERLFHLFFLFFCLLEGGLRIFFVVGASEA